MPEDSLVTNNTCSPLSPLLLSPQKNAHPPVSSPLKIAVITNIFANAYLLPRNQDKYQST